MAPHSCTPQHDRVSIVCVSVGSHCLMCREGTMIASCKYRREGDNSRHTNHPHSQTGKPPTDTRITARSTLLPRVLCSQNLHGPHNESCSTALRTPQPVNTTPHTTHTYTRPPRNQACKQASNACLQGPSRGVDTPAARTTP